MLVGVRCLGPVRGGAFVRTAVGFCGGGWHGWIDACGSSLLKVLRKLPILRVLGGRCRLRRMHRYRVCEGLYEYKLMFPMASGQLDAL